MQDIVFSFDLTTLTIIFCIVFPIYWFVLRKQIFFWFDPLLAFVFFNSIAVSLVIYLYFFMHTIKLEYFLSFSFCSVAFIIGMLYGGRKGIPRWDLTAIEGDIVDNSNNYSLLVDIFMIISLFIMVSSNLLLFVVKGTLPILSSNPSEAKIILYTGGWGIVKRINLALVNYVLAIPLIKIFHPTIEISVKQKGFYISCILACVLVLVGMGSKSSLLAMLNVLFVIVLINRTVGISILEKTKSLINEVMIIKWTKYVFIIAIAYILIIISLSGVETSSSDSVLTRLVSAGDVFYFFYAFDIASDFHKTALDYIPHFFNPLLGMLRLTDYEFSMGVYVVYYALGLPMDALAAFGPNAQHPIEGLVYFGKYGAPIYSFSIGYIISFVRIVLLRKIGPYPNCITLVMYVVISSLIVTMGTDVPLFMQIFFDLFIYGVIILIFAAALLPVFKMKKNEN